MSWLHEGQLQWSAWHDMPVWSEPNTDADPFVYVKPNTPVLIINPKTRQNKVHGIQIVFVLTQLGVGWVPVSALDNEPQDDA